MKIMYMKRSRLVTVLAFVLVLLMVTLYSVEYSSQAVATSAKKPIYSVDTDQKKIAISFDAAWGADKTDSIMDILDSKDCRATFFLVGFWVEKYPDKVKSIAERGFEIGNHSANHPRMSELTAEQMRLELTQASEKIMELTGTTPTVFRPPFGAYNDTLVTTVNELSMHCVQWSIDSLDWKERGVEDLISRTTKKVKNGDILLFHNNSKFILEALPQILDSLKKQGFEIVSVSDLIYTENYIVDNNGVQRQKTESS